MLLVKIVGKQLRSEQTTLHVIEKPYVDGLLSSHKVYDSRKGGDYFILATLSSVKQNQLSRCVQPQREPWCGQGLPI